MRKIGRRMFAILLIVVILCNGMGVMAEEDYGDDGYMSPEHVQEEEAFQELLASQPIMIAPCWLYAEDIAVMLNIKSSGVATCTYDITAGVNVTEISNYVYLQKLNTKTYLYETIASWNKKHYTFHGIEEFKYTLSATGIYRHKLTTYIYDKSRYEKITLFSDTRSYVK